MSEAWADRLKFVWPPVLIALVFLGAWQLLVVACGISSRSASGTDV